MPQFSGARSQLNPALSLRAGAAIDTAYQPNTTRDVLVCPSVQISSGAVGDGKIELLSDAANPPTTVVATLRLGIALAVHGGQLVGLVKAGHYYKLRKTDIGGTPSYSIVGDIPELAL